MLHSDTIAAVATPAGQGGVGVIRISGPLVRDICESIAGPLPDARTAVLRALCAEDKSVVDTGIILYFQAPASYTGEHVLELHSHGSPVVLDMLLRAALAAGARLARPGEFTERAYLNGKMDLAQAESVADLISAQTEVAARSATQSLQGKLSRLVEDLSSEVVELRAYVEATIDFPDDDTEFLQQADIGKRIQLLVTTCTRLIADAQQGVLLNEGLRTVIAGSPNVGKSSLLNALTGTQSALVTNVPGTTRDIIRETVQINGIPLVLMDTAGLRETDDLVERLGNERAHEAIAAADLILLVVDATNPSAVPIDARATCTPTITIYNKIDLLDHSPVSADPTQVMVSAKTSTGLETLRAAIRNIAGLTESTQPFIARRRHLHAFEATLASLNNASANMQPPVTVELVAEELRLAHEALQTITGRFTTEDLLGEIFSTFCIGK